MITETVPGINPYHYCYNNPIRYRDLFGLDGGDPNQDMWGRQKYDENGMYIPPTERPTLSKQGDIRYGHYEDKLIGFASTNGYYTKYRDKNKKWRIGNIDAGGLKPIYKAFWVWDTDKESNPLSYEDINDIASRVGTAAALISVNANKAYKRTFAYTNTNTLVKPTNVMIKLPAGSLHISVSTVKRVLNISQYIGDAASIYSTGYAYNEILYGDPTLFNYSDAAVGSIGLGASTLSYFSGVEYPGIGYLVAIYGSARLGWDIGWSLAPKYGPINGSYWSWNK